MKLAYDLHIHSCLSPCGDEDMTPNNILNMAKIKSLDIIAVTDHNSGKNVEACSQLGKTLGILVLPGMEIQTREEVHMLCYFESIQIMNAFENQLEQYRLKVPNRPEKFGNQWVMNAQDQIIEAFPFALILSLNLSINDLYELVHRFNGVLVPAHINKASNSLLTNLGFIPPSLKFDFIEVFKPSPCPSELLENFEVLSNSDAHSLGQISEPDYFIDVDNKTLEDVILYLKRKDKP